MTQLLDEKEEQEAGRQPFQYGITVILLAILIGLMIWRGAMRGASPMLVTEMIFGMLLRTVIIGGILGTIYHFIANLVSKNKGKLIDRVSMGIDVLLALGIISEISSLV